MTFRRPSVAILSLILLVLGGGAAPGAATYAQDFDAVSISQLESQGWIFRTLAQGNATGGLTIAGAPYPAHSAPAYLHAEADVNDLSSTIVSWAVLPAVNGLQAGDVLRFYFRNWMVAGDLFEVRYAPNGGINTGGSVASTGDFSQVLTAIDAANHGFDGWTQHNVAIPGGGRIALRFRRAADTGPGTVARYAVDTLAFNLPLPGPPIPAPGETAHWTAAISPVELAIDRTIPLGGTLIVDPGVEVRLATGVKLRVHGAMQIAGTAASPARVLGPGSMVVAAGGVLTLDHVDMQADIAPAGGAEVHAADCVFTNDSDITGAATGFGDFPRVVVTIERCVFAGGSDLLLGASMTAVRDSDFTDSTVRPWGYALLDNVTVTGGRVDLLSESQQPTYVGGVSVVGNTAGPGLLLSGRNFFIDSDVELQGNLYPVQFGLLNAGILDGSTVPASGNLNNEAPETDNFDARDDDFVYANIGVPYVVSVPRFVGWLRVSPGAIVKFQPGADWIVEGDLDARGAPGQPVRFGRQVPGQPWGRIQLRNLGDGSQLEWCVFEGATTGLLLTGSSATLQNCEFTGNDEGLAVGFFTRATLRGGVFANNGIGVSMGHLTALDAEGEENPSRFMNNGVGLGAVSPGSSFTAEATGNWWGDPSGPASTQNPSGAGDIAGDGANVVPFLEADPADGDSSPRVRIEPAPFNTLEPGAKQIVHWSVDDDGDIVSQRILFSPNGNASDSFAPLGALSPSQRSFEFDVPSVGLQTNGGRAFLRVEATDDAGQIGVRDQPLAIIHPEIPGALVCTSPVAGLTFQPGDQVPLTWTWQGVPPTESPLVNAVLLLDADERFKRWGSATYDTGTTIFPGSVPDVSTDSARIALVMQTTLNTQKWFFSEPFSIRPHAALGDEPPQVEMTSPVDGGAYTGVVPVAWTASDDEALRSFNIQISTDGGRFWQTAARDLPETARSFTWSPEVNGALVDMRLRVVAIDKRFQNSSSGADRAFSVAAGVACEGDVNGDLAVDFADLNIVLSQYNQSGEPGTLPADLNGDGVVDFADLNIVLGRYGLSC